MSLNAFCRLRAAAGEGSLLFRQLFDAQTGTITYLQGDQVAPLPQTLQQSHVGRHCNAALQACQSGWRASLLIPLPKLAGRVSELPANEPVVVVCHSGSRWADEGYPLQGVISPDQPIISHDTRTRYPSQCPGTSPAAS